MENAMPDYKEMYLKMLRATEAAMNCLIAAQRECEERYIQAEEETVLSIYEAKSDANILNKSASKMR